MEDPPDDTTEDVDRRDERDPELLATLPVDQLVPRPRVPAHLRDREPRAGADLEPQLQQLRDEVAFDALEGIDRASGVERRALGCEVLEKGQQTDRVDVEHRRREATEALLRVVARQREDVMQALAREPERDALERGTRPIAAREVDDDVAAHVLDRPPERERAEPDVAPGVVGDRHRGHAWVGREAAREVEVTAGVVVLERPGPGHELHERDAPVGTREGVGERGHRVPLTGLDGAIRATTSKPPLRGRNRFQRFAMLPPAHRRAEVCGVGQVRGRAVRGRPPPISLRLAGATAARARRPSEGRLGDPRMGFGARRG